MRSLTRWPRTARTAADHCGVSNSALVFLVLCAMLPGIETSDSVRMQITFSRASLMRYTGIPYEGLDQTGRPKIREARVTSELSTPEMRLQACADAAKNGQDSVSMGAWAPAAKSP